MSVCLPARLIVTELHRGRNTGQRRNQKSGADLFNILKGDKDSHGA